MYPSPYFASLADLRLNSRTTRFKRNNTHMHLRILAPSCVTFQTAYILVVNIEKIWNTQTRGNLHS
jgi:hypothetical protein